MLLTGGLNYNGSQNQFNSLTVTKDGDDYIHNFGNNPNVLLVGGRNYDSISGTSTIKGLNITNNGDLRVAIVSDTTSGRGLHLQNQQIN